MLNITRIRIVRSRDKKPYDNKLQGWTKLKKEFESVFRTMTQLGYAVFFISHEKEETFKRPDGTEFTQIKPSVSNTYNSIVENMADIYGRMFTQYIDGESKVKIALRSLDGSVRSGGRFKYIAPVIDSSYESLVEALNNAIDKEAEAKGSQYVTNEREKVVENTVIDFDKLMARANEIFTELQNKSENEEAFAKNYVPRITQVVETYLGKGKKLKNCTRDQGEMLKLIVADLEELLLL